MKKGRHSCAALGGISSPAMAHRTGPVRRGPPGSGRAEGQSLTEPITPSFHKIAFVLRLAGAERASGVAAKRGPCPQVKVPDSTAPRPIFRHRLADWASTRASAFGPSSFAVLRAPTRRCFASCWRRKRVSRWTATKSRASLRALYATGRFVEACRLRPSPARQNGLSLVFVATENYFNGDVNVDGTPTKTNPKAHQLVESSKLDLGDTFSQEKVDRSVERMLKVHGRQRLLQSRHHL